MKFRLTAGACLFGLSLGCVWLISREEKRDAPIPPVPSASKRQLPQSPKKRIPQLSSLEDSNLHWEDRVKAVRDLPNPLDSPTVEMLFAFLQNPPAGKKSDWYLVCNEIMEVLRKYNHLPGIYTARNLSLIQSTGADPVIRDYSAQHLAQWISGIDPSACEQDPGKASAAFAAMCEEASNPANGHLTLAGTTLNGLADAVINGNSLMQQERGNVGLLALKILDSPQEHFSNLNRATAIQVAARLQVPELPERCRALVSNSLVSADLRLSAIAALGLVGEAKDRELLESFASNETFKFAAAAAVERVHQKYSQP